MDRSRKGVGGAGRSRKGKGDGRQLVKEGVEDGRGGVSQNPQYPVSGRKAAPCGHCRVAAAAAVADIWSARSHRPTAGQYTVRPRRGCDAGRSLRASFCAPKASAGACPPAHSSAPGLNPWEWGRWSLGRPGRENELPRPLTGCNNFAKTKDPSISRKCRDFFHQCCPVEFGMCHHVSSNGTRIGPITPAGHVADVCLPSR
jgi:hypothetical protein